MPCTLTRRSKVSKFTIELYESKLGVKNIEELTPLGFNNSGTGFIPLGLTPEVQRQFFLYCEQALFPLGCKMTGITDMDFIQETIGDIVEVICKGLNIPT